ncbi:MAG: peptide deformylase [Candidatus Pacearchaeota archaeon]|jgi:peptide deformylase|nr:peptide deformylase [Clostridia bacterium]
MKIEIIKEEQTPLLPEIQNPHYFGRTSSLLINELIDFVKYRKAVGLAANQVSVDGNRLMDRFFLERKYEKETAISGEIWSAIINPSIIERIGMTDACVEGCLTWPGYNIMANRYRRIKVKFWDEDGVEHTKIIIGFRAHIWQHEINHLDGVHELTVERKFGDVPTKSTKIDRNAKCPCGSDLKYKKCCGPFEIFESC